MRRFIIIGFVLICLSACAVGRSKFESLERQVAVQEEKILILEEQVRTLDLSTNYQINEQMMALNNRINVLESRNVEPVQITPPPTTNLFHDDINALYNEGRRQYEAREFAVAIRTFQQVLNQSPNHDLAANAIYWMGESYYAMADFTAARQMFQRIQESYPDSNKFIDAQVKIAMTWLRHGNKSQARTILEGIRRTFPSYERMHVVDQQLRLAR